MLRTITEEKVVDFQEILTNITGYHLTSDRARAILMLAVAKAETLRLLADMATAKEMSELNRAIEDSIAELSKWLENNGKQ